MPTDIDAEAERDPAWNGIRLFVSSTFRDMQGERHELATRVFPRLRQMCAERGLAWREVDLRWGVTEEEAQGNRAIPICLAEVDRCRPYFIGILGERYGWVPEEIPAALLEREPWLAGLAGASVTEMEITHFAARGDLRTGPGANAFFYLRDPQYILDLPEAERDAHMESATDDDIARWGPAIAEQRADDRIRRLAALKARLRKLGVPIREDYPNPRALADLVLRDLSGVIDTIAPAGRTRDWLEIESAYHDAFSATRCELFVGREDAIRRLDQHAKAGGGSPPLVVGGEPGAGQSALLAWWARRHRRSRQGDVVFTHFVGASPTSGDTGAMLRRLMGLMQRRLRLPLDLPPAHALAANVRDAFIPFLRAAAAKARVTLVLDGLDRLPDAIINFPWLADLPAGVCVIVSAGSGAELQALRLKEFPVLWLPMMTREERALFVRRYLGQYSKSLPPGLVNRIAANPLFANPRCLMLLLEELRVTATHQRLSETLDGFLSAEQIEDLYSRMIHRLEKDADRAAIVRDALRLLWASRGGLTESELLELLGTKPLPGQAAQPLPQAHWSGLYVLLRPVLQDDHGLLRFSDPAFRRAIAAEYLATRQDEREVRTVLADYFLSALDAPTDFPPATRSRMLAEVPWQLAEAGEWARLRDFLSQPRYLPELWNTSATQVRAWWVDIARETGTEPHQAYAPLRRAPNGNPDAAWAVATLLDETGRHEDAAAIRRALSGTAAKLSLVDTDDGSGVLNLFPEDETLEGFDLLLGENPPKFGQGPAPSAAEDDLFELTLEADDSGVLDLADSVGLSDDDGDDELILDLSGDDDEVLLLDEPAAPRSPAGGKTGPAKPVRPAATPPPAPPARPTPVVRDESAGRRGRALVNEAISFGSRRDYAHAISLYRQADPMLRAAGDDEGLQACLGNLGAMLLLTSDLPGAEAAFAEQERVCRACGNRVGLAQGVANRAVALQMRGDRPGARVAFAEAEQLARENGDAEGIANALVNRSSVTDRAEDAEPLLKEAEQIYRRQGMLHRLGTCLAHRGKLLVKCGNLNAAGDILREAVGVCSRTQDPQGQAIAVENLALVLLAQRDLPGALRYFRQAEAFGRAAGDRPTIFSALLGQAEALAGQDQFDAALTACRTAEPIAQAIGDFNETRRLQSLTQSIQDGSARRGQPQRSTTAEPNKPPPDSKPAAGVSQTLYLVGGVLIDAQSPQQAMAIAGARHHLAAADKAAAAGDFDKALGEAEHAVRLGGEAGDLKLQAEIQSLKGQLLGRRGRPDAAVDAAKKSVEVIRQSGDAKALADSLGRSADVACDAGRYDEAMKLRKEQQTVCERRGDVAGASAAATAQAQILFASGDLNGAYTLASSLSAAAMARQDATETWTLALLQSQILAAGGEARMALELAEVAVTGYRQLRDERGLARALLQVGLLTLMDLKQPEQALQSLREAESLARAAKVESTLGVVLGARAEVALQTKKYDEAVSLLDEQVEVCRRLPNQLGLAPAMNRRVDAELIREGLRSKKLDALMREAEKVARATGNTPCLLTCLRRQLAVANGRKDGEAAGKIIDAAESAARAAGDNAAVSEFLRERAKLADSAGRGAAASAARDKAEKVARASGDEVGAAVAIAEQAATHAAAGRAADAIKLYAQAAATFAAHNRRQERAACQAAEASVRISLGETDAPTKLLAEAEPVFRQLNDRRNLATCLASKVDLLEARGDDVDQIIAILVELHSLARQLNDREALAVHLARYADLRMRTPEGIDAIISNGATPASLHVLNEILGSFVESEKLMAGLGNFDGAARVMMTRANALSVIKGRGAEAMSVAQQAMKLANDHGLVDLARALTGLMDQIRARVK